MNTFHPNHQEIFYTINYGYIPNTVSNDGEEIDAYVLGVDEPIEEFCGYVKAIIVRKNDNEDKLVVCPLGKNLNTSEVKEKTNFQEKFFDIEILM